MQQNKFRKEEEREKKKFKEKTISSILATSITPLS